MNANANDIRIVDTTTVFQIQYGHNVKYTALSGMMELQHHTYNQHQCRQARGAFSADQH